MNNRDPVPAVKIIFADGSEVVPGDQTFGLNVLCEERVGNDGQLKTYFCYQLPDVVQVAAFTGADVYSPLVTITEIGAGSPYQHLVGGGIESDEDPLEAARRELLEETGYDAEKVVLLTSMREDTQRSFRFIYLVAAFNCQQVNKSEEVPEKGIAVMLEEPLAFRHQLIDKMIGQTNTRGKNSLLCLDLALHKKTRLTPSS